MPVNVERIKDDIRAKSPVHAQLHRTCMGTAGGQRPVESSDPQWQPWAFLNQI